MQHDFGWTHGWSQDPRQDWTQSQWGGQPGWPQGWIQDPRQGWAAQDQGYQQQGPAAWQQLPFGAPWPGSCQTGAFAGPCAQAAAARWRGDDGVQRMGGDNSDDAQREAALANAVTGHLAVGRLEEAKAERTDEPNQRV